MAYLNKALEFNGLDNNGHFGAMLMLGQLQLQEDKYAEALATIDRFLAETKSQKPEHLVLKGNALYRMDRFPEAAAVLKQAIDASPEPKADWQQLLMATYFETGQGAEAAKMAEAVAAKNPADKRAQMNLAAVYLQGDMYDKAAAVLEKMRAAGQLTEDKDYRQLYSTYLNMEGKEKQAVDGDQRRPREGRAEARLPDLSRAGAVVLFLRPGRSRRSTPTRRPRRSRPMARPTSTSQRRCGMKTASPRPRRPPGRRSPRA